MNIINELEFLFSLRKFGMRFDLRKVETVLQILGNPEKKLKIIHVAGTNGKGSTSTFIASILKTYGYKVGLYTSPHLSKFNERIVINGEQIPDEFIIKNLNPFKKYIEKYELTFFDITTIIAYLYFSENDVDYAVIETGLGGRLDSTNTITPEVSVITSIGIDHQNILGNTIELITLEKAGIIKKDRPVIHANNLKVCKNIVSEKAKDLNSKYLSVDENYFTEIIRKQYPDLYIRISSNITNKVYDIRSPLFCSFQIDNISTAIATIETLFAELDINVSNIINGINNIYNNFQIAGRFQKLNDNPLEIIDTSHNSQAINMIIEEFKLIGINKKFAIFGVMKDKLIDDSLHIIADSFDKIFVCSPKYDRALKSDILFERLNSIKPNVENSETIDTAYNNTLKLANKDDGILIFGSNYLIAEFLDLKKISKLHVEQII